LALYLKWGGAIAGDPSTYRGVPDMTNQEKSMLDFIGREAGINVEGLTLKDVIKKAAEAFKKKK
jgi:hypothetical protein